LKNVPGSPPPDLGIVRDGGILSSSLDAAVTNQNEIVPGSPPPDFGIVNDGGSLSSSLGATVAKTKEFAGVTPPPDFGNFLTAAPLLPERRRFFCSLRIALRMPESLPHRTGPPQQRSDSSPRRRMRRGARMSRRASVAKIFKTCPVFDQNACHRRPGNQSAIPQMHV